MNKPSFLFVNIGGDWLSIAQRIKEEGYDVYFYKTKGMVKGRNDTGVGILTKSEMKMEEFEVLWKFREKKEDLIILYDDNGFGHKADLLKFEGWKVIGGSAFADDIEYERDLGLELMNKIGLDTPYEKEFTKFDEAISFLESEPEEARYVFKPNGEDFAGSSKTYTGKNRQDLIDYVKWMKADTVEKHYDVNKFVLQEFIEGIEADFSAYFDGEKFMEGSICLDIEEKKSGDGNKGEATGCMGNVLLFVEKTEYYDKYIANLVPYLKKINFVGQIALNNIFSSKSQGKHKKYEEGMPYGLEFTPRFGWDAHLTEMAIHKRSGKKLADFYIALANKQKFDFNHKLVGCGVRVYTGSVNLKKDEVQGRYFSFKPYIEKNLWYYSTSKKNGAFQIEDNPVLVCNTVGNSVTESIAFCYAALKNLNVPDVYYRMEIGKRASEVVKFLAKYKWL